MTLLKVLFSIPIKSYKTTLSSYIRIKIYRGNSVYVLNNVSFFVVHVSIIKVSNTQT